MREREAAMVTKPTFEPTIKQWLVEPLTKDVKQSIQRLATTPDVTKVAVMPDVHLANDVCIGTAVATRKTILPAAIGSDIGCGMAAVRFESSADLLREARTADWVLQSLRACVPTNRHAGGTLPPMDQRLIDTSLGCDWLNKQKLRDGAVQLGTLGRGNHFLEFQTDSEDQLWLMVHSGSRAMGQIVTRFHVERSEEHPNGLRYFATESPEGLAYLKDVEWCLRYASESRRLMIQAVASMFADEFDVSIDWSTHIDCHHNHVQRESLGTDEIWVHRKGAQAANEGQPGLIPGSMGTSSFHVLGRGCDDAMRSCSHGAGRRFSRSEARRRISLRQFKQSMRAAHVDLRKADALRDEAPDAYKDIRRVMKAQRKLVKIERELRPLLTYKGT